MFLLQQQVRYLPIGLILILLFMETACKIKTTHSTEADLEGLYRKNSLWEAPRASICFADGVESTPELRRRFQQIAEGEFNAVTVFQFSGFKSCKDTPDAQIEVKIGGRGKSKSTIGKGSAPRLIDSINHFVPSAHLRNHLVIHTQNDEGVPKSAAILHNLILHELGHAAGLLHEQRRRDNVPNHVGYCTDTDEDEAIASAGVGEIAVGPYDILSIMNYCRPNFYSEKVPLSAGDMETLEIAYGSHGKGGVQSSDELLHCAKVDFARCAKGNGGISCLRLCDKGELTCHRKSRLAVCLRNKGGAACLGSDAGDCG